MAGCLIIGLWGLATPELGAPNRSNPYEARNAPLMRAAVAAVKQARKPSCGVIGRGD